MVSHEHVEASSAVASVLILPQYHRSAGLSYFSRINTVQSTDFGLCGAIIRLCTCFRKHDLSLDQVVDHLLGLGANHLNAGEISPSRTLDLDLSQ